MLVNKGEEDGPASRIKLDKLMCGHSKDAMRMEESYRR